MGKPVISGASRRVGIGKIVVDREIPLVAKPISIHFHRPDEDPLGGSPLAEGDFADRLLHFGFDVEGQADLLNFIRGTPDLLLVHGFTFFYDGLCTSFGLIL